VHIEEGTKTFREQFPIGPRKHCGAIDKEINRAFFHSSRSERGAVVIDRCDSHSDELKNMLPDTLRQYYDKMRRDPLFTRLVLYTKNFGEGTMNDGMIIGFADDSSKIVLATWDPNGHDVWEPEQA
jgi:hypothetical protein